MTSIRPIGDLVTIVGGGTPTRTKAEFYGGGIPWVTPKDMKTWDITGSQVTLTSEGVDKSPAKLVEPNAVLVVVRSGVLRHTLPIAVNRVAVTLNQDMKALICRPGVHPDYLARYLKWRAPEILSWVRATTADNFPVGTLRELEMPVPPMEEQWRIAAILDHADALRSIRRQSLRAMDLAVQAIFDEMFGDPAVSSHGYPMGGLGSLASVFSDGPFGSNLKSSHYVESGVRVVRLQNIGAGEFRDGDAAYISEDHFTELRRHECRPGDVLIATLGDPNLRACLQPEWLSVALNKADCVQMRVDTAVADSSYVVALLNHPGTLSAAGSLVLGQTRGRISMGRLRGLKVPLPPLGEQREFAARQRGVGRLRRAALDAQRGDAELHGALLDRAFKGEL